QFQLGFQALHDWNPAMVGDCTDDESHNPANGDGLQHTTAWHGKGGLLVWRKADNWTAFTDGSTTWINGPFGVQSRPNAGPCFVWESCGSGGGRVDRPVPPSFASIRGGRPGQTASAAVQAAPGVRCVIEYVTPLGTVSRAQGLVPRTTDSNGRAAWSWVIGT